MTNETIILIGICCLILCLVLLAIAVVVFTRRVVKAMQTMWDQQKETWKAMDESQEIMMGFMLEFARVQLKSIQDLGKKVPDGGDGQGSGAVKKSGAVPVKPARLAKGSPEAKDTWHRSDLKDQPKVARKPRTAWLKSGGRKGRKMPRLPVLKGKTRPYKAGRQVGASLVETSHILYLLDNRLQYLEGIKDAVDHALDLVRHEIRVKKIMNNLYT